MISPAFSGRKSIALVWARMGCQLWVAQLKKFRIWDGDYLAGQSDSAPTSSCALPRFHR